MGDTHSKDAQKRHNRALTPRCTRPSSRLKEQHIKLSCQEFPGSTHVCMCVARVHVWLNVCMCVCVCVTHHVSQDHPATLYAAPACPCVNVRRVCMLSCNMQDHPATLYAARSDEKYDELSITSQIYDKKINIRFGPVLDYLFNKRGPLTSTGCDHGAFLSTTGT